MRKASWLIGSRVRALFERLAGVRDEHGSGFTVETDADGFEEEIEV
jgi:hypothetical protein